MQRERNSSINLAKIAAMLGTMCLHSNKSFVSPNQLYFVDILSLSRQSTFFNKYSYKRMDLRLY